MVMGLADGGPAETGGLRAGDVIEAVAGEPVADLAALFRSVWALGEAGVRVPLTVRRDGRGVKLALVSGDRERFLRTPVRCTEAASAAPQPARCGRRCRGAAASLYANTTSGSAAVQAAAAESSPPGYRSAGRSRRSQSWTILSAPRAKALVWPPRSPAACGLARHRRGGGRLRPRLPPQSLGPLPPELGAPPLRLLAPAGLLRRLRPAAPVLRPLRLLRAAPVLLRPRRGRSAYRGAFRRAGGTPFARPGPSSACAQRMTIRNGCAVS